MSAINKEIELLDKLFKTKSITQEEFIKSKTELYEKLGELQGKLSLQMQILVQRQCFRRLLVKLEKN